MEDRDLLLLNLTMSLTRTSRAYKSVADRLAANYGLSQATAWPVIMIGRLGDGVRPGEVAEALGLEPSSLVRVIDQLIASGLVARHEDANDRRAKTLHLTADGRRRAAQLEKALVAFRRELFQDLQHSDLQACVRVFDALGKSIAAYEPPAAGARSK